MVDVSPISNLYLRVTLLKSWAPPQDRAAPVPSLGLPALFRRMFDLEGHKLTPAQSLSWTWEASLGYQHMVVATNGGPPTSSKIVVFLPYKWLIMGGTPYFWETPILWFHDYCYMWVHMDNFVVLDGYHWGNHRASFGRQCFSRIVDYGYPCGLSDNPGSLNNHYDEWWLMVINVDLVDNWVIHWWPLSRPGS